MIVNSCSVSTIILHDVTHPTFVNDRLCVRSVPHDSNTPLGLK